MGVFLRKEVRGEKGEKWEVRGYENGWVYSWTNTSHLASNITDNDIEQTPLTLSAGGKLIYISKKRSYKLRRDLNI